MIVNNIDPLILQETWIMGNRIETIRNYTIFYRRLLYYSLHRGERGVTLILSPKFYQFFEDTRGAPL